MGSGHVAKVSRGIGAAVRLGKLQTLWRAPELNWKLRFPRLRHRTCRTRTPSGCHWKEELALLMKLSLTCIMPGQLNPEFCQLHGFVRLCSPFK